MARKRPQDDTWGEASAKKFLKELGYGVTKRGWPDYFCMNKNEDIMLVEVKDNEDIPLRREQVVIFRALQKYGVPCYRYDKDHGLTEFDYEKEKRELPDEFKFGA